MELRSKGTALGIPSPAGCSEYSGLCSEVGPGFCPEYVRKAGSGIAADQTNAMLAVVRADDASLASPQAGRLVHSVARPLLTEPAVAGLRREPCSAVECLLALAVKTAHSGSCGLERRSFALTQVSVSQVCFQMQKAEKQLLQGFPHLSFRYRADANQMQNRGRKAGAFNLPQLPVSQCFQ